MSHRPFTLCAHLWLVSNLTYQRHHGWRPSKDDLLMSVLYTSCSPNSMYRVHWSRLIHKVFFFLICCLSKVCIKCFCVWTYRLLVLTPLLLIMMIIFVSSRLGMSSVEKGDCERCIILCFDGHLNSLLPSLRCYQSRRSFPPFEKMEQMEPLYALM